MSTPLRALPAALRADPPLDARTLLRESLPVVVVLFFWAVLAWPALPPVESGLRTASVVLVALYVVVRGVRLSRHVSVPSFGDTRHAVRESVRAAVPATGWFVAAHLVVLLESLWDGVGLPGLFTSPRGMLVRVFVLTGVATVGLYAVAVGAAALRADG